MITHPEPADLATSPAESCLGCGTKTRTWLAPHTPMCFTCADTITHVGFRTKRQEKCEKCDTPTFWAVQVGNRLARWCGCDNAATATTATAEPMPDLEKLPALWGTPKQVAYGRGVRRKALLRWYNGPIKAKHSVARAAATGITDATWWIANKDRDLDQVEPRVQAALDPTSYDYTFDTILRQGVNPPWFARRYGDNKLCLAVALQNSKTVTIDPWGNQLHQRPGPSTGLFICQKFSAVQVTAPNGALIYVDLVVSPE